MIRLAYDWREDHERRTTQARELRDDAVVRMRVEERARRRNRRIIAAGFFVLVFFAGLSSFRSGGNSATQPTVGERPTSAKGGPGDGGTSSGSPTTAIGGE